MKKRFQLAAILLLLTAVAQGQVAPAATGPGGVLLSGTFQYTLRYAQTGRFGGNMGNSENGIISGDMTYANANTRRPFSLMYGGGYEEVFSGPTYGKGISQHLILSQGMFGHNWNATVSDDVSYTPQSPTVGFLGIAGSGGLTGATGASSATSATILTQNTHTVTNTVTGDYQHNLNRANSLAFGGTSNLLCFPDGNGLNTDTNGGQATYTDQFNARNSVYGQYQYSRFTYPGYSAEFATQAGTIGFKRSWTRQLSTDLVAGPQWTSSNAAIVPSSLRFSAKTSASYTRPIWSASLGYNRGTTGGAGYMLGAHSDSVLASYTHDAGRSLSIGLTASYLLTSGLQSGGSINSKVAGAQVSRRFGRYLSAFASYTAMDQSSSSTLASSKISQAAILSQLNQTVGFGMAYIPRVKNLR